MSWHADSKNTFKIRKCDNFLDHLITSKIRIIENKINTKESLAQFVSITSATLNRDFPRESRD